VTVLVWLRLNPDSSENEIDTEPLGMALVSNFGGPVNDNEPPANDDETPVGLDGPDGVPSVRVPD
jgi:hypothetical protein